MNPALLSVIAPGTGRSGVPVVTLATRRDTGSLREAISHTTVSGGMDS